MHCVKTGLRYSRLGSALRRHEAPRPAGRPRRPPFVPAAGRALPHRRALAPAPRSAAAAGGGTSPLRRRELRPAPGQPGKGRREAEGKCWPTSAGPAGNCSFREEARVLFGVSGLGRSARTHNEYLCFLPPPKGSSVPR